MKVKDSSTKLNDRLKTTTNRSRQGTSKPNVGNDDSESLKEDQDTGMIDNDADDDDETKETSISKSAVTLKKTTKSLRKLKTIPKDKLNTILYIGHLPKHFEEREIRLFLKQFGKVTDVYVSRSLKTGNSKGHAFVRFREAAVATIAAETLSGYVVMQTKRLVCHLVPTEKYEHIISLFNRRAHVSSKVFIDKIKQNKQMKIKEQRKPKSLTVMPVITDRLLQRQKKRREKIKAMGIEYDFPGYDEIPSSTTNTLEDSVNTATGADGKNGSDTETPTGNAVSTKANEFDRQKTHTKASENELYELKDKKRPSTHAVDKPYKKNITSSSSNDEDKTTTKSSKGKTNTLKNLNNSNDEELPMIHTENDADEQDEIIKKKPKVNKNLHRSTNESDQQTPIRKNDASVLQGKTKHHSSLSSSSSGEKLKKKSKTKDKTRLSL